MKLYIDITDNDYYDKNKFIVNVKTGVDESVSIWSCTLKKEDFFTKSGKLKERKLKSYIKNRLDFTCNVKLHII